MKRVIEPEATNQAELRTTVAHSWRRSHDLERT